MLGHSLAQNVLCVVCVCVMHRKWINCIEFEGNLVRKLDMPDCGCIARTRLFKWFRVAPSAVIGHHSCICQDEVTCEAHRTNIRGAKHVTEGMGLMTFWDS